MKIKSKLHALEGTRSREVVGGLFVVVGRGNPSSAFVFNPTG
jgi:hypothetical protein